MGEEGSPQPCGCFPQYGPKLVRPTVDIPFHSERQDTTSPAWQHLQELIDEAAADARTVFAPLEDLSFEESLQIVTLPKTIDRLTAVKEFDLQYSNLVRIPPEIGAMANLEEFRPYKSHRLHWFPYEITRCAALSSSLVSTRSLYGNRKLRQPFPRLQRSADATRDLDPGVWGASEILSCSVCGQPMVASVVHRVWISLCVATDVLPLLVNACSQACIAALPPPAEGYIGTPHLGGVELAQPPANW